MRVMRVIITVVLAVGLAKVTTAAPIISNAKLAYVNDGQIVVVDDAGKFAKSGLYGEHPGFSAHGSKLAYDQTVLIPEPDIDPETDRIYNLQWISFLWDLSTGQNRQIVPDWGVNVQLSPSGARAAYVCDTEDSGVDALYARELPQVAQVWVSDLLTETFVWLGEDLIVAEDMGQLRHWRWGTAEVLTLPSPLGSSAIDPWMSADQEQFYGFCQQHPRPYDFGNRLAFVETQVFRHQWAGSSFNATYQLVMIDRSLARTTLEIGRTDRADKLRLISQFAINNLGTLAAVVWRSKGADQDELEVISLDPAAPRVTRKQSAGWFTGITSLAVTDNAVYVGVVDPQRLQVKIDGEKYVLEPEQLDPRQLEALGLPTKITDADIIYRIDAATGKRTVFAQGHGIVAR